MRKLYFYILIAGLVATSLCTAPLSPETPETAQPPEVAVQQNTTTVVTQQKCSESVLDITEVTPDVQGSTRNYNITVKYVSGTQDLYDFSFSIQDKFGLFATATSNIFTRNNSFKASSDYTFPVSFGLKVRSDRLDYVRVRALCATDIVEAKLDY